MLKISARDVTSKGMEIDQTIPKEGIGLSDEEIDLRSPLMVKAHLERAGNMVLVQANLKADFGFTCARCLEQFHEEQTRSYDFNFEIGPGDEYIDLGDEIRQELIMENPPRILCQADCLGICPGCGTNLNLETCKCKK